LVSLCEAHRVIETPLARVLRGLNALRNKCAHQAGFEPSELDWEALRAALSEMDPGTDRDRRVPDSPDSNDPLELIVALVESCARRAGATDIGRIQ